MSLFERVVTEAMAGQPEGAAKKAAEKEKAKRWQARRDVARMKRPGGSLEGTRERFERKMKRREKRKAEKAKKGSLWQKVFGRWVKKK